ncbi:NADH-quinone oxidoreductase subunit J [Polymorphobacter arshaanensis]|uniref:NADH-quinone oxidoreductase subunit J n=1 Tax=Glacieibacterium arshaanense TaxID=2511025 RepID=A0A4Y9EKV7_9SPHN|nr:proton-conducting transporter membrane subunit [Polymorphobacter arshaanensis]TFU01403.1 NADH-quinone oxidoreductase subunit J [Polymorphobacter arshaanensis]
MTTPSGWLLVAAVLLPFIGMMVGLVAGGRHAARVAALVIVAGLAIAFATARTVLDASQVYLLGGWAPPLGVALRADGLAAAMMVVVAAVIAGIGLYARRDFATPPGVTEARAPLAFWLLLLAVWGSLNLVFVSGDLFTLYVGLELLTFAGVPLVCLDGRGETLRAALRYLLFALLGSLLYLLGAVLIYGAYATLDIEMLAHLVQPGIVTWTVLALMTVGLLAKTALFPLHIWLPPAHAGAPAAASAVLSALVVKGSWFLVVRLWFDVMPAVVTFDAAQLLGGLGAAAIVFGSIVALRQKRLKLLVAYSTIAQIGYLFLMFPLAFDIATGAMLHGDALTGGLLQAASHATAKAGMFMAAGLIYAALGHDRIADLGGVARALPVTVLAFAVAGLALMGLVPSGAYLAKKLLLGAAASSEQWWWTAVLQGGAAFTAGYVVLVLTRALRSLPAPLQLATKVSRLSEFSALGLALLSLLLGVAAVVPAAGLPAGLISNPLAPKELLPTLLVVAGGFALAATLARRPLFGDGPWRRLMTAAGTGFENADALLRRWPTASLALIILAAAFGWLLHTGNPA